MKLFFPFFLIFSFIIYSRVKKSITIEDQQVAFLEKERKANETRRQNIDNMDYITIPLEKLPFLSNPSQIIAGYEKKIRALAEKRILNLGGISNTDLKMQYGAANLPQLSEYDENYLLLVTTCGKWSEALIREGFKDEAVALLETAVDIGCDSSSIYVNLNALYKERGIDKTDYLVEKISATNSQMKDSIIKKLKM